MKFTFSLSPDSKSFRGRATTRSRQKLTPPIHPPSAYPQIFILGSLCPSSILRISMRMLSATFSCGGLSHLPWLCSYPLLVQAPAWPSWRPALELVSLKGMSSQGIDGLCAPVGGGRALPPSQVL